jgi:hypothetical protein
LMGEASRKTVKTTSWWRTSKSHVSTDPLSWSQLYESVPDVIFSWVSDPL